MSDAAATHIDAFAAYLAGERQYSPATIVAYRQSLNELRRIIAPKPFEVIGPQAIRLAVARLASMGRQPRSMARALSAWRSFYRWGVRHQGFNANPAAGIRAPKASKPLPKALSVDHAVALMERGALRDPPDGETDAADLRDAAMFELFYSSGLRLAELIGLDTVPQPGSAGWVDDAAGEVTVTGKGRKTRTVPVGKSALKALARWRTVRSQFLHRGRHDGARTRQSKTGMPIDGLDEAALFLSPRGRRVSPSLVYTRLKRWTLKAGVPAHVHPHVLRHSFATHMLQSTGDLRAVQELLGHANITTTQVYTHLDFQALAKVYDASHPRAKFVAASSARNRDGDSRATFADDDLSGADRAVGNSGGDSGGGGSSD